MMDSMKQWFGLIRHRVYFLVGLGVVVTLLAGSVSFFVFNTLDVVTLISRVKPIRLTCSGRDPVCTSTGFWGHPRLK
jgi:hypothetical protein